MPKKRKSQLCPPVRRDLGSEIGDLIRESQTEYSSAHCLGQTPLHLAASRDHCHLIPRMCKRYPKLLGGQEYLWRDTSDAGGILGP
jgi:hypothetical protein